MLEKLQGVMDRITGSNIVDEELVNETCKEIQRILIQSDVSVKLVKELTDNIKRKAKEKELPKGVSRKEHLTKLIYNELAEILGGEEYTPRHEGHDILLTGLYGQGKTTTAAKIADYYSKRGLKTCMITTDVHRPAAYEQLAQLGEEINIDVYGNPNASNAEEVLKEALGKTKNYDLRIIDSAGRDNLKKELLKEIENLEKILKPEETFLVLSADTGQTSKKLAKKFNESIELTGVIVTKTDTSAKAGGALTACYEANIPIAFIGTGEKTQDFKVFDAENFVANLLGQPDLGELLKRVKRATEETELSPEDLMKKDYNFQTFYKQLEAMNKMGSLEKILKSLGMSNKLPQEELQATQEKMGKYKYMLDSMTDEELKNPKLMNKQRIKRIAKGSGRTEGEVKELIQHFNKGKKMIKRLKEGKMRGMGGALKNMKKGKGPF